MGEPSSSNDSSTLSETDAKVTPALPQAQSTRRRALSQILEEGTQYLAGSEARDTEASRPAAASSRPASADRSEIQKPFEFVIRRPRLRRCELLLLIVCILGLIVAAVALILEVGKHHPQHTPSAANVTSIAVHHARTSAFHQHISCTRRAYSCRDFDAGISCCIHSRCGNLCNDSSCDIGKIRDESRNRRGVCEDDIGVQKRTVLELDRGMDCKPYWDGNIESQEGRLFCERPSV